LPLRDGEVTGPVVAHEHHVVGEIHRVVFGERAARAEEVQDLHGLRVLHLVFAGHRDAAGGEQRGAEDDGRDAASLSATPVPL
jgi:hypothetical protein